MKLGLFGKILLAFWLTLFLMSQVFWFLYAADHGLVPSENRSVVRAASPVLALLADRVSTAGPADAQRARLLLPSRFRDRISIALRPPDAQGRATGGYVVTREAVAPDGRRYFLVYQHPRRASGPLDIPVEILAGSAVSGLVFSLALAAYLTRPLIQLRAGFRRMAQGDLDVQLQDELGRRGDELSDVARDFDLMVLRLRQLITARDRLLNDVSHELRSPLTRLQLAIGLARQDPERTADSLARIELEARKLEEMVGELLALARAESAADAADEYFDPILIVESVVADARFEAQMSGRRIDLVLPCLEEFGRPSVQGSAALLRRAIENVVRNALRFSPVGCAVQVDVEIGGAPLGCRLTVADQGAGVEPAALDKVFDPFMRGDAAGIGLGLAIAKRAVLAHGGRIEARNRDGGGFVVEIGLPAVAEDPPPEADLSVSGKPLGLA